MLIDVHKKIIQRYFLGVGEEVLGADVYDGGAVVSSNSREWRVETLDELPYFNGPEGYVVYNVCQATIAHPPLRPHGVALLTDGGMFHINDDAELRAFWQRAGRHVKPLELATLLTRYQGRGRHVESHQNLIVTWEDLRGRLDPNQIDSIPEFTIFRSVGDSDETLNVHFCSFFFDRDPDDNVFKLGLNRWRAWVDSRRYLQWSVRPIACGLCSPRYSRND